VTGPTQRLVVESFGIVVEVTSDDPELFSLVPGFLPPGWRPAGAHPEARFGVEDGKVTVNGARVPLAGVPPLWRLGSMVRHYVAEHAPAHVFVHAGVVRVAGCLVVIPGSSRSGKTTLVAELVRTGALYYSDEYAVVAADGRVEPFAKPLSVRTAGAAEARDEVPVPPGQVGVDPAEADLVVLTSYEPGARWQPRVCTRGEGALAILEHTVPARHRPREAMAAAGRLAGHARVLSGPRGEAGDTVRELLEAIQDTRDLDPVPGAD
jgi:hypothetical protein